MELGAIATLLLKHKDFLFWLDIEFYASFAIIAACLAIAYGVYKKFLIQDTAVIGKVIAIIVFAGSVTIGCISTLNILNYSKNKLDGCRKLKEEKLDLLNIDSKARLKLNDATIKALEELEQLLKECIESEKEQGAGA